MRSAYAFAFAGDTTPLWMYGFSTVLMSIASPYACIDQCFGPGATAKRQLNDEVLSAAVERESLPWKTSIGSIVRIGKRAP